tara:strand:+ start:751 stop:1239 length:489 start_codon:yes stop_codon:yes gene_type:complete
MNPEQNKILKKLNSVFLFKIGSLLKLPMAFLSGLKILKLDSGKSLVQVKYNYLNKNPFNSTYFAVLSMAAELSTGLFALLHTTGLNPTCAFIITGMKGDFLKKGTGITVFNCNDGEKIKEAVLKCTESGKPAKVTVKSIGENNMGERIAEFEFTWSFKQRSV